MSEKTFSQVLQSIGKCQLDMTVFVAGAGRTEDQQWHPLQTTATLRQR